MYQNYNFKITILKIKNFLGFFVLKIKLPLLKTQYYIFYFWKFITKNAEKNIEVRRISYAKEI